MNNPQWTHKFELKPGSWVFVPNNETLERGKDIKSEIESRWKSPHYYAHFKAGGHVAALKKHIGNKYFIRADIKQFFNRINRTRVTRELKKIYGDYKTARMIACESVVFNPSGADKEFILPFGFPQSAIIASLCLHNSSLGQYLDWLTSNGFVVTVYMDDILVSSSEPKKEADAVFDLLNKKAERSRFDLNPDKTSGPKKIITAFNINLTRTGINITDDRLAEFADRFSSTSHKNVADGILGYVNSVNPDQASSLLTRPLSPTSSDPP